MAKIVQQPPPELSDKAQIMGLERVGSTNVLCLEKVLM